MDRDRTAGTVSGDSRLRRGLAQATWILATSLVDKVTPQGAMAVWRMAAVWALVWQWRQR